MLVFRKILRTYQKIYIRWNPFLSMFPFISMHSSVAVECWISCGHSQTTEFTTQKLPCNLVLKGHLKLLAFLGLDCEIKETYNTKTIQYTQTNLQNLNLLNKLFLDRCIFHWSTQNWRTYLHLERYCSIICIA